MKRKPLLKILLIAFISLQLIACHEEEDGIFFENSYELKTTYSTLETEDLKQLNKYRMSKNLSVLEKLDIISSVACSHSTYMSENLIVNHDNFPERNSYLINEENAEVVGENVAYGFGTAKGVVNAWLNSTKHKAIIENDNYTNFGLSIERDSKGQNYFTLLCIKKN